MRNLNIDDGNIIVEDVFTIAAYDPHADIDECDMLVDVNL